MREKRKLERFDLKAVAKIEDGERRGSLDVMTSDICSGGAFFRTDQSLPVGTEVRIDLLLPLGGLKRLVAEYDHVHMQFTGTVLRRESLGMAVCFHKDYKVRPGQMQPQSKHGVCCATGRSENWA